MPSGVHFLRLRDNFHARLRKVSTPGGQSQGRQQAGYLPVLSQPRGQQEGKSVKCMAQELVLLCTNHISAIAKWD